MNKIFSYEKRRGYKEDEDMVFKPIYINVQKPRKD